jgi:translation initiation factor IF-3
MRHIQRFLNDGNKVKIRVMMRGREKAKPELAIQILDRVFEDTKEIGFQDGVTRRQSWAVSALLCPVKAAQGSQKKVQSNREKEDST